MAKNVLGMFSQDGFRKMWRDGPDAFRTHLESLMTCMEARIELTKKVFEEDFSDIVTKAMASGMPALEAPDSWTDTLNRLVQIIKFTQYALGFPSQHDASAKDVVWLLQFRGQALDVETDLAGIVTSTPSWCAVCDEVIRTAKTSVQLRPVLERATESLQNPDLTLSRMQTLLQEVDQLRAGMRKQDCTALDHCSITTH